MARMATASLSTAQGMDGESFDCASSSGKLPDTFFSSILDFHFDFLRLILENSSILQFRFWDFTILHFHCGILRMILENRILHFFVGNSRESTNLENRRNSTDT